MLITNCNRYWRWNKNMNHVCVNILGQVLVHIVGPYQFPQTGIPHHLCLLHLYRCVAWQICFKFCKQEQTNEEFTLDQMTIKYEADWDFLLNMTCISTKGIGDEGSHHIFFSQEVTCPLESILEMGISSLWLYGHRNWPRFFLPDKYWYCH